MHADRIQEAFRQATVVVVGGANTDVVGVSDAPLLARDSNPGHVRVGSGGVGRNIAENLSRLGIGTHLITAFGADGAATTLAKECEAAGIDISASLHADDLPGSRYVAIADSDGDMALALNDMRALERITPDVLDSDASTRILDAATLIVIDANLPAASIAWLARGRRAPLLADAVSAAKTPKLEPVLPQLAVLKANALEASTLLGREIAGLEAARDAAIELVGRGVGHVFLTLGTLGCVHASSEEVGELRPSPAEATSTTGAGDAFTAGIAAGSVAGLSDPEAVALATALARRTMLVETSVDPTVDCVAIVDSAKEMLA